MRQSTVSGNTARQGGGGGIQTESSTALLENVTVSGNTATSVGGGGIREVNTIETTLVNVTVANNRILAGSGANLLSDLSGTLVVRGTLVADPNGGANCSNTGNSPNGTIDSEGSNLSDDRSCTAFFNQSGGP